MSRGVRLAREFGRAAVQPTESSGWHSVSMHVRDFSEDELLGLVHPHLPRAEGIGVPSGDDYTMIGLAADSIAISTDMLVEGVHYRSEWSTGYDIGWRTAMQNTADVAVMGARPVSFIATLSVPSGRGAKWLTEFARDTGGITKRFGTGVNGGDLIRGPAAAGVTVVDDLSGRPPVLRSGARPGDHFIYCGVLGRSATGLHFFTSGAVTPECVSVLPADGERSPTSNGRTPDGPNAIVAVHKHPNPPVNLALTTCAAGRIRALTGVFDGLVCDARRMTEASSMGIDIDPAAPKRDVDGLVCAGVRRGFAEGVVFGGGEDRGFLVTTSDPVPEGWQQIDSVRELNPRDKKGSGGSAIYGGRNVPKEIGRGHFRAEHV